MDLAIQERTNIPIDVFMISLNQENKNYNLRQQHSDDYFEAFIVYNLFVYYLILRIQGWVEGMVHTG